MIPARNWFGVWFVFTPEENPPHRTWLHTASLVGWAQERALYHVAGSSQLVDESAMRTYLSTISPQISTVWFLGNYLMDDVPPSVEDAQWSAIRSHAGLAVTTIIEEHGEDNVLFPTTVLRWLGYLPADEDSES